MNYFVLKHQLEEYFKQHNVYDTADIDWIMVEVLGKNRSLLPFAEISDVAEKKIWELAKERAKHVPLDYIFGKSNFFGYDFKVNRSVLIPRQDTEVLIEQVIKAVKEAALKPQTLLDIGTGSGAIAITLNLETGLNCTAVDISDDALIVAKENAKNLNAKVKFLKSDLFENLKDQRFDIVVSNPPYIKSKELESLEPEVVLNEPILALDGGDDGLKFYKKIINCAPDFLNPSGMLFFEIGYDEAKSVTDLMRQDFADIQVIKDYSGNDRVVFGKLKEKL